MKTKMSGLLQDYQKMFKAIINWNTGDSDLRYFLKGTHPVLENEDGHWLYDYGWSGELLKNENKIYDKIELSYSYLLKSLAEAIGYDFPEDQDVWKYHLSDINTDNILKLKE